mmetsp:Transcript_21651/g.49562  ORF Transcript_21651/g.49562 Transcript_21651/m.49562 type:complete len:283 (+) Transcript_21651:57-905(+)
MPAIGAIARPGRPSSVPHDLLEQRLHPAPVLGGEHHLRPDAGCEGRQVQCLRVANKAVAGLDGLRGLNGARVVVVEHPEELQLPGIFRGQIQGQQILPHVFRVQHRVELRLRDGPAVTVIVHGEGCNEVLHDLVLVFERSSIHRRLHEECRDHVHHREEHEAYVDDEGADQPRRDKLRQRLHHLPPMDAVRDGLEQHEHGLADPAKKLRELLLVLKLLLAQLLPVLGHHLGEEQAVDVGHDEDQEHGPDQALDALAYRHDQLPQGGEGLEDAGHAQHADKAE